MDCDGPHALAACLFGNVFGGGGVVVVVDCDVCAAGCEFEGDGGADAAAGAGDWFCSVGGIGESVGGGDGGLGAYRGQSCRLILYSRTWRESTVSVEGESCIQQVVNEGDSRAMYSRFDAILSLHEHVSDPARTSAGAVQRLMMIG